jgi:hypothetical protein
VPWGPPLRAGHSLNLFDPFKVFGNYGHANLIPRYEGELNGRAKEGEMMKALAGASRMHTFMLRWQEAPSRGWMTQGTTGVLQCSATRDHQ